MERKLQQAGWWSLIMAGLAGAAYLPYRSVSVPPTERPGALTAQSQAGDGSRDAHLPTRSRWSASTSGSTSPKQG